MTNKLTIGIPNGSLVDPNRGGLKELLDRARIFTKNVGTNSPPVITNIPWLKSVVGRPQELPQLASAGYVDIFFCGDDWVQEWIYRGIENDKMLGLEIGRVDVVVASKIGRNYSGVRVATEYSYIAREFFSQYAQQVDFGEIGDGIPEPGRVIVIPSAGATEAKPFYGVVEAVVDVTQSGSTLGNFGLSIEDTVMKSECSLYRNQAVADDPWKMQKADRVRMMLDGALNAYGKDLVTFNVPNDRLDKVLKYIRRNQLFGDEETVIRGDRMSEITLEIPTGDKDRSLIDVLGDLKDLGASSIEGIPLSYSIR